MMMGGMTITAVRDGSRESLEQFAPPGPNGPGLHVRQVYDFAAHKVYTTDLNAGQACSVQTYTSPSLPAMYDPIAGAEEATAGLAQTKPAKLRTETVNGIATTVYELANAGEPGKNRLWLADKYNFTVKWVTVAPDGKEATVMEVKSVSFAKPPADLLVAPQNCRAVAGETNANGGHVETTLQASSAANEKAAAENPRRPAPQAAGRPADSSRAAGRGQQGSQTGASVTGVRVLGVRPAPDYNGAYPATFEFAFSVTVSGPTEIKYVLLNQDDRVWESGTLAFEAAGTKELKIPVKVGVPRNTVWKGWAKLRVYEPNKIETQPVNVSAAVK
jgi:hypothetical protein